MKPSRPLSSLPCLLAATLTVVGTALPAVLGAPELVPAGLAAGVLGLMAASVSCRNDRTTTLAEAPPVATGETAPAAASWREGQTRSPARAPRFPRR